MEELITFLDDAEFCRYRENILFARLSTRASWPRTRISYYRLVSGAGLGAVILMLLLALISIEAFVSVWLVVMLGLLRLAMVVIGFALAMYSTQFVMRELADEKYDLLRLSLLSRRDMFDGYYYTVLYRFRSLVGGAIGFYGGMISAMSMVLFYLMMGGRTPVPRLHWIVVMVVFATFDLSSMICRSNLAAALGVRSGLMHKANVETAMVWTGVRYAAVEIALVGASILVFMPIIVPFVLFSGASKSLVRWRRQALYEG